MGLRLQRRLGAGSPVPRQQRLRVRERLKAAIKAENKAQLRVEPARKPEDKIFFNKQNKQPARS